MNLLLKNSSLKIGVLAAHAVMQCKAAKDSQSLTLAKRVISECCL